MSILNISYNQPGSHLAVGSETGYTVYSLTPNIEKKLFVEKGGGVGLVKMLQRTNLSLLVGGGANPFSPPTKVVLWDDFKKVALIEFDLKQAVKNIFIDNEKIILIVLQKEVFMFNFDGLLTSSRPTYSNDNGICTIIMNDKTNKATIATLGMKKGEVVVWQPHHDICKTIQAHNSNVEAIALNKDSSLLATASETGTIIKVFFVETNKSYELRRGTKSAKIYSLAFSKDSNLLACCSNNGTVHIFDVYKEIEKSKNTTSNLWALKDYFKYFGSQWAFKQIAIDSTAKMICTFDANDVLHVTCMDGKYYRISGQNYDVVKQSNLHIDAK
jgi:WD40 repeat protein